MSDALSDEQLEADLAFAIQAAREAGTRALGLRESGRWEDPKIVGDVGDQAADGFLQGFIRGRYPDDGLLSEETRDDAARCAIARAWIVDPLDGTKEFRTGREDWAVHVALTFEGRPAIGVVALPSLGQVFWGICLPGRERSGVEGADVQMLAGESTGPAAIRIVCSRSHTPDWMQRFAEAIGPHELVPIGSVGFKSSRILVGDADVYVHKTGLKEWDTCAPEGLARANGWFVSRVDGSEQLYNQPDPYNDELVICRPAIKDKVLAALQQAVAQ